MAEQSQSSVTYIHGHHASVLRSHSWRTAENSAAYLLPSITSAMHILDVGCGPGTISTSLASHVPSGHVTGMDMSPSIVEQARATAALTNVPNVTFTTGDIHALPFGDSTFDVVHAHQVLQHVHDPVHALQEMRRVAKPGGIVAARESDYSGFVWFPEVDGMQDWKQLYLKVARACGGEPDAGRRLLSWARASGFARAAVTATAGTWCYSTAEERKWWSEVWAERTLESSFSRNSIDGGHANEDELRRIAEAWTQWGKEQDGWFTVLHGEILCRV